MNTIEQAREVSSRIWIAGYIDESATIDALIAELASIKAQEPIGYAVGINSFDGCIIRSTPLGIDYVPVYRAAGAQPTVTCQIYGHVVGACAECNTHNEVGAQPVPAGYQLVPVEPTMNMLEMGSIATDYDLSPNRIKPIWQQLLMAAAREPVQAQERKPFGYYDPSTKQFAIDKDELPRGAVVWPVYREQP